MSNDQLSWDQLLSSAESSSEETESKTPASPKDKTSEDALKNAAYDARAMRAESTVEKPLDTSDQILSADDVAPRAAKKKSTRSSKRVGSKTTSASDSSAAESAYSKKNWGKLEFAAQSNTVKVQTTETTETKVTLAKVETPKSEPKSKSEPLAEVEDDLSVGEPEPTVLSVSELNRHIRDILEGRFPLIWLKAEISNFKAHTSGHFYFSLKDSKAQINAVMFRGFNSQLRFRPEDGMEVLVRGKITVYEPRGNYQIFCEVMEPVGAGALQKAFEQLKAKLQREGLFDEARKRPLPSLPKHIAIVTSPTGAAIRDMLNVLGRRFKGAQITVIPCKVQGDQAPREIIQAIQLANRLSDVDVMIVGRGGGSIEDLWAFNDEGVARAIAAARVPVISAVGHEIDFTIADFVADLRAPTPSAAAELVVKNASDLAQQVAGLDRALRFAVLRKINTERQSLTALSRRLVDPQRRIQDASQRCDELMQRLEAGMLRSLRDREVKIELFKRRLGTPLARIEKSTQRVSGLEARLRAGVRNALVRKREALTKNMAVLDSLSPLKVLDRGFSMVTIEDRIITDATDLKVGQTIHVRMCQGAIDAQVVKVEGKKKG